MGAVELGPTVELGQLKRSRHPSHPRRHPVRFESLPLHHTGLVDVQALLDDVELDQAPVLGHWVRDPINLLHMQPANVADVAQPILHEPEVVIIDSSLDSTAVVVACDGGRMRRRMVSL